MVGSAMQAVDNAISLLFICPSCVNFPLSCVSFGLMFYLHALKILGARYSLVIVVCEHVSCVCFEIHRILCISSWICLFLEIELLVLVESIVTFHPLLILKLCSGLLSRVHFIPVMESTMIFFGIAKTSSLVHVVNAFLPHSWGVRSQESFVKYILGDGNPG